MTSLGNLTEREMELIRLLTQRFRQHALDARITTVNTLEGAKSETLRLTLDDTVSTDFTRERIADESQTVEALAEEAAVGLDTPGARIGP